MRSRIAELASLAFLVCALAGCGLARGRAPSVLAVDDVVARLPNGEVVSLEGTGRLSVRDASSSSDLAFELAYLAGEGLRLDFTWKSFIGLVRRDGSLLVRGDSVWVRLPDDEIADPYWGSAAARDEILLGLSPADFLSLFIAGSAEVRGRASEIVAARSEDSGERWRIVLARAERVEEVLVDAATGDVLAREIRRTPDGRTTRITYSRHRQAGVFRRPFSIDVRDSASALRGRIAFSRQVSGAGLPRSRFQPGSGERLLGLPRDGAPLGASLGTLFPKRGRPES